jgi:DNA topoisomerase-1
MHESGLRDRRLAAIVRRCQELPGQELFQYVDDEGAAHDVASDDVNDYLREASGGDFTAKDVRTWAGTVLAFRALRSRGAATDDGTMRRNLVAAIRTTAERLGNTPAVARGSYVHPAVGEGYLEGKLEAAGAGGGHEGEDEATTVTWSDLPDRGEELALLRFLKEERARTR